MLLSSSTGDADTDANETAKLRRPFMVGERTIGAVRCGACRRTGGWYRSRSSTKRMG